MTFDMFTPVQKDERQVHRPPLKVSLLPIPAERRGVRDQCPSRRSRAALPAVDLLCSLPRFSRRWRLSPEYAKGLGFGDESRIPVRRQPLLCRVFIACAVVLAGQTIVLEIPQ
ncbi:hypothetical protein D9M70_626170 [compost metagenome]